MIKELEAIGIMELSEMQKAAANEITKGSSVILLSSTGTGKTLAFLYPMLEMLSCEKQHLQAIVIVPSRELALQLFQFFLKFKTNLRGMAIYGGHPTIEEQRKLSDYSPQILFATPGRFLDYLQKRNIDSSSIRHLVIDEYDKCLELGFMDDLQKISKSLSAVKQYIFTSATSTTIPNSFFPNTPPKLITLDYNGACRNSKNVYVVEATEDKKLQKLGHLLCEFQDSKSIVFVTHREDADVVGRFLKSNHFFVETYHGGMEQQDRERALYKFRSGCSNILVSTDLAARGLDIPDVNAIIHYHLPLDEKTFVHRNGRTGRWKADAGKVYVIHTPEDTLPDFMQLTIPYHPSNDTLLPYQPRFVALYIGRGKKDKVSKGDVVGFLCKVGNLSQTDIGNIEVGSHHTYVAIDKLKTDKLLKNIVGQKIKGMKTLIELMRK